MHGDSFQRKLAVLTNKKPLLNVKALPHLVTCEQTQSLGFCLTCSVLFFAQKPKRRVPVYSGRSSVPDKPQPRSRSVTSTTDRSRVRGRSPAFNALAANFGNVSTRNLSTPPPMVGPMVRKLYPKSHAPDLTKLAPKSAAIAARTAIFEKPKPTPPQETPTSPGSSEGLLQNKNFTFKHPKLLIWWDNLSSRA